MNMIDYMAWRGDLTFEQSPFNEVDNLIFCYLAYVNLDQVAPEIGEEPITIEELSKRFFEKNQEETLKKDKSFIRLAPMILYEMAKTRRFQKLLVQNYVNKVELDQVLQFAALEVILEDGSIFVAYRGTDDTIVGWKEDFYLSKGAVQAEEEAVRYFNLVGTLPKPGFFGKLLHNHNAKKAPRIRIGGHSKGGHLAIYAAANCEIAIQDRIIEIYDNDGPGFLENFIHTEGYQRIKERIRRHIPESSVIGLLLKHEIEPTIVQSSQKTIMQHDGFSWEVLGPRFVACEEISKFAALMDEAIQTWLEQIPDEQREQVIHDLFSALEATGAETLTELQDGGMKTLRVLMKQIEGMDSASKGILQNLVKEIMQRVPQMIGIPDKFAMMKKK